MGPSYKWSKVANTATEKKKSMSREPTGSGPLVPKDPKVID